LAGWVVNAMEYYMVYPVLLKLICVTFVAGNGTRSEFFQKSPYMGF